MFELANVCRTKISRAPEQRETFLQAFGTRGRLNIASFAAEPEEVIVLALRHTLSVYDAGSLWLANTLSAEQAEGLARVARRELQVRAEHPGENCVQMA
jgi:hypothetical protein